MNPGGLKKFALLVEFSEEDRLALCELLAPQSLEDGETLFCEGDEADSLFLVKSGRLRAKSRASGALGLLCEGSTLGGVSLMTIGVREVTVFAQDPCELLVLSREGFRRLAEDAPRAACRLAEAVVADLATGLRPHLVAIQREFPSDDVVVSAD